MNILTTPLVSRPRRCSRALLLGFLFVSLVFQGQAVVLFPYNLTSSPNGGIDSSTAQVNLNPGNGYVPSWQVDGVNMLSQQLFYYSVGNNLAASIDTMPLTSSSTTLGGAVKGTYAASGVSITPTFSLTSGVNSGGTYYTLGESILVKNTLSTPQTINFFQYSDFSLGIASGSQTVNLSTINPNLQYQATQAGGGTYPSLQDGYQIVALGPVTTTMQAGNSGLLFGPFIGNTPLDNATFSASGTVVDYAFESSATLGFNQSFTISEFQTITVPEPSSVALISLGMLALAVLNRRRWVMKLMPCR